MLNKSRAVVLHHVKYGESSLIVTLYTEMHGRMACIVNNVRSRKSKFPVTYFQPLSLLEIDLYYRQSREIQRLKEISCPYHYTSIPFHTAKRAIALFIAEVLYLSLREEESNPVLFSFIYHSLQLLDAKDEAIVSFHPWFMLHLSKYLGFYPPANAFERGKLTSDIGIFYSLPGDAFTALKTLALSPESPPELRHISHSQRNELVEGLIRYYSTHIEGFSRIKSYEILHEVFESGT
jgi:DNA repair protein RecO (recombination protein O)